MKKFLIRPSLNYGESPDGYALRLGEANGIGFTIVQALGYCFDEATLDDWGCVPQDMHSVIREYIRGIEKVSTEDEPAWRRTTTKYCAACLQEAPYWRVAWDLQFVEACPVHHCWLLDTCPGCDHTVSLNRNRLLQCDCGCDYRVGRVVRCGDADIRLANDLEAALCRSESGPFARAHSFLSTNQLQQLVLAFGCYGGRDIQRFPQKIIDLDVDFSSWPISTLAAQVLSGWPESFQTLLSQIRRKYSVTNRNGLPHTFGYIYRHIFKKFCSTEFAFVRHEFTLYLRRHWSGGIGLRNRLLTADAFERPSWIPASKACHRLSISQQALLRLVEDNSFALELQLGPRGRKFWSVKADEIEILRSQLSNSVTLTEAVKMLGISKRRLSAVLTWLVPSLSQNRSAGHRWIIPKTVLEDILHVRNKTLAISVACDEHVTLDGVLRYWKLSNRSVALLLRAIVEGEIVPAGVVGLDPGLGGLVFMRSELSHWYNSTQRWVERSYSVPEAARILHLKQEVVYSLVRNGHLQSHSTLTRHRRISLVTDAAIAMFRSSYVLCRDLAVPLNTSSTLITKKLLSKGVSPVCGPGLDDCRQILFRRNAELQEVLVAITRNKS